MGVPMGRLIRQRHEAEANSLDLLRRETSPTARILVQVYDGGAIPTAADRYYLTHPVVAGGNECEGCAPSTNVDASTTIPVVVVGYAASAGDLLVAHSVGGRWVAEGPATSPLVRCGSSRIPPADFTVSWDSLPSIFWMYTIPLSGTDTLRYLPTFGYWKTDLQVAYSGMIEYRWYWFLWCNGTDWVFQLRRVVGFTDTPVLSSSPPLGHPLVINSQTDSPVYFYYTLAYGQPGNIYITE
jgi:hypothetical protein